MPICPHSTDLALLMDRLGIVVVEPDANLPNVNWPEASGAAGPLGVAACDLGGWVGSSCCCSTAFFSACAHRSLPTSCHPHTGHPALSSPQGAEPALMPVFDHPYGIIGGQV